MNFKTEKQFEGYVRRWLIYNFPKVIILPKIETEEGWPDLIFTLHKNFYGIELKTNNGKLQRNQKNMLQRLKENHWITAVWRPKDFKNLVDKSILLKYNT